MNNLKGVGGLASLASGGDGKGIKGRVDGGEDSIIANVERNKRVGHDDGFVLVLYEYRLHPVSYLKMIVDAFESLSVIRIYGKAGLEKIKTVPLFDSKYLIVFESNFALKANLPYINLDLMFPMVVCETYKDADEAEDILKSSGIRFKVCRHSFMKEDAFSLIYDVVGRRVSDAFCKRLVSVVGLNPERIISGLSMIGSREYTVSNVNKYVDKYSYVGPMDVIQCMFGMQRSKRQVSDVAKYLYRSRFGYEKYVRPLLVEEMETVELVFTSKLNGELTSSRATGFMDSHKISTRKFMLCEDIFAVRSFVEVEQMARFIKVAKLLQVVGYLTGMCECTV